MVMWNESKAHKTKSNLRRLKILNTIELIVNTEEDRITTIRKMPDSEDIVEAHYEVIRKNHLRKIVSKGYAMIIPEDGNYDYYNGILRKEGLW